MSAPNSAPGIGRKRGQTPGRLVRPATGERQLGIRVAERRCMEMERVKPIGKLVDLFLRYSSEYGARLTSALSPAWSCRPPNGVAIDRCAIPLRSIQCCVSRLRSGPLAPSC